MLFICPIFGQSFVIFDEPLQRLGAPWLNTPWPVSNARGPFGDLLFRDVPRQCDVRVPLVRGIRRRVDVNRWA